jgi:hypothetical protein
VHFKEVEVVGEKGMGGEECEEGEMKVEKMERY